MTNFNWNDYAKHVDALRNMGCAVVVITPEDIHDRMDPDESGVTIEQATTWLRDNYDDVEEAILGDYWGDTIRDLIALSETENA